MSLPVGIHVHFFHHRLFWDSLNILAGYNQEPLFSLMPGDIFARKSDKSAKVEGCEFEKPSMKKENFCFHFFYM